MIQLLNLPKQNDKLDFEIKKVINEVLKSGQYINGPNVKNLEKEIAEYLGVNYSIGVGNGTDALIIALEALGISNGDEVITTPWTFFATVEAIMSVGAKPVFVDVNLDNYNLKAVQIEEKITSKTKAILPVHVFGYPCEMDTIMEIAKKYNLFVIEDCAQAIGSKYKNKMIGSFGDISTFSFFPTKNLGCIGDGGLIATNSDKLSKIVRGLKAHGSGNVGKTAYNLMNNINKNNNEEDKNDTVYNPAKYYNYFVGHNSRLDEIQAAILRLKLKYLDSWNKKRCEIAKRYNDEFEKTKLVVPKVKENIESAYHLYILQSDKREKIVKYLNDSGISTGIYYPIPMHLQKALKKLGYKVGDFPNAEYLAHRTFAIPASQDLSDEEIEYIIDIIKRGSQNG